MTKNDQQLSSFLFNTESNKPPVETVPSGGTDSGGGLTLDIVREQAQQQLDPDAMLYGLLAKAAEAGVSGMQTGASMAYEIEKTEKLEYDKWKNEQGAILDDIRTANISNPIEINGESWSVDQIKDMNDPERIELARQFNLSIIEQDPERDAWRRSTNLELYNK